MNSSATTAVPATTRMVVNVNDEPRTLASSSTIADLVGELGLADRKGVAIAVTNTVVPRAAWPTRLLIAGERVLVIRATQGG